MNSICVPKRIEAHETPVVYFFMELGEYGENRANITVEITPELIQELRDSADKAEQMLATNTKAKTIKARFDAAMETEGAA